MKFIEQLNKRYACKQMNGKQLPQEKVDAILEAIRLAPTSKGLQSFKVFVVESQALKDEIYKVAAPGQPQIPKSSQVLIFAPYLDLTPQIIEENIALVKVSRPTLTDTHIQEFRDSMRWITNRDKATNFEWSKNQAYLALGFALAAAAVEEVDSVPIEGFFPEKLDELLNLKEQNLGSVCLLALGYSDKETDYNAHLPKVRKEHQDLFNYL